jgi:membrane protein YqaA with SNARE-associated domain
MSGAVLADPRGGATPSNRGSYLWGVLGLLVVAGLTALLVAVPIPYRALGQFGYLGVFAITLLATASIVLPVPYIAAIIMAGSYLNPLLVALVAGTAAAIGELTGYAAGVAGSALIPDNRWTRGLTRAMKRYGALVVFGAAVLPNPFFDGVGIIAGATRQSLWGFVIPCFLGKTLRFWALAALGTPLLG